VTYTDALLTVTQVINMDVIMRVTMIRFHPALYSQNILSGLIIESGSMVQILQGFGGLPPYSPFLLQQAKKRLYGSPVPDLSKGFYGTQSQFVIGNRESRHEWCKSPTVANLTQGFRGGDQHLITFVEVFILEQAYKRRYCTVIS
jgi:hypothetical protein